MCFFRKAGLYFLLFGRTLTAEFLNSFQVAMNTHTPHAILPDLLECLGVPHTYNYSEQQFRSMSFKTLFGFRHLLKEYGVESEGLHLSDKSEMCKLPTPFLALTIDGEFIIVSHIDRGRASYLTEGVLEHIPSKELTEACTGDVLLTRASQKAIEPDFEIHARKELALTLRNRGVVLLSMALFLYLFIAQGVWRSLSATLIVLLYLAGLMFSFLLVGKSAGMKSRAADKVCGVLQDGGCDTVLSDKASKFFGVFGWSEVGLSYFGVSLTAMLVFPHVMPYLALFNACCLPFTFWSIWYQRFRAKAWCTLCVSVQCTLWLLFFCFVAGGWFEGLGSFSVVSAVLLGVMYLLVFFLLNMFTSLLRPLSRDEV